MRKLALLLLLILGLNLTLPAKATLPNHTEVTYRHGQNAGSLSMRYWYGNSSIDQTFKGEGIDVFSNTKTSGGILVIDSDYWFGYMTPEGLFQLGTVFGMGISAAYADWLVQDIRLTNYWLDFQFAKLALLHDESWKNSLVLSGHYTSYYNSIYDNIQLTQAAPFFGIGLGLEGKISVLDTGEISFGIIWIPYSRTPTPVPDGWGLNSELNTRWFITPRLAFNVGYRFNFYNAGGPGQAVSVATGQPITIQRTLQDMYHGVIMGFTHYF